MKALPAPGLSPAREAFSRARHSRPLIAVTLLVALAGSGATSCSRTQVALSTTAIAAVVVGTTVGVTLAVQHHNHTVQGCVFADADGLKLRTSDAKVYSLKGISDGIKGGERLKLHGSKVKKPKGDTGAQVFLVEKLNKDYGPCTASVGP